MVNKGKTHHYFVYTLYIINETKNYDNLSVKNFKDGARAKVLYHSNLRYKMCHVK